MNVIRIISYVSRRTYTKNFNAGIQGKLRVSRKSGLNVNAEELNHDDLDEFEAEFTNADQFYDIHEREQNSSKEIHKNRIVANKYFKETKDPNFLTSIERHKIRELHKNDPEEWTVQRLSESFPALPETIKKILKSNWLPDSIDKVLQYDATVVDNWKKFQIGSIPLSPLLRRHLEKFKDRQIVLPDKDLVANTIMQSKRELPKPKSKYFSGIIKSHLDYNKNNQYDNKALQDGEEMIINKNISRNMDKEILVKNNDLLTIQNRSSLKNKVSKQKLTWNEFVKRELPKIYESRPEKAITLLQVYKNLYGSQNTLATNIKKNIVESNNVKTTKEEITLVSKAADESSHASIDPVETADTKLSTLATDIKEDIVESNNVKTTKEEITLVSSAPDESSHASIDPVETADTKLSTLATDIKEDIVESNNVKTTKEEITLVSSAADKSSHASIDPVETADTKLSTLATDIKEDIVESNNVKTTKEEITLVSSNTDESSHAVIVPVETADTNLDTYIKARNSKISENEMYSLPIKIPRNIYQKGKTYRVNDCYYDDNGQFLYRVPGIRN